MVLHPALASVLLWIYLVQCTCALSYNTGRQSLALRVNAQRNHADTKWMVLTLGKGAKIDFSGSCSSDDPDKNLVKTLSLSYRLLTSPCAELSKRGASEVMSAGANIVNATGTVSIQVRCSNGGIRETFAEREPEAVWKYDKFYNGHCRERDEAATESATSQMPNGMIVTTPAPGASSINVGSATQPQKEEILCRTQTSDAYALVFHAHTKEPGIDIKVVVDAEMKNTWGYLSAQDYPLLPFHACMTAIYVVCAFVWLIAMISRHKYLPCLHYWIAVLIGLSLIENVIIVSELCAINFEGRTHYSILIMSGLLSIVRITLFLLLMLTISLGIGVIKPRLSGCEVGMMTGYGIFYFSACVIKMTSLGDNTFSLATAITEPDAHLTLLISVLAVVVLSLFFWITFFVSLIKTMRTVWLSQNYLALSMYRYFLAAIIFGCFVNSAFIAWSVMFQNGKCIEDWHITWLSSSYDHIVSTFWLLTIMILWGPSANKNHFAYSPLAQADEQFDGMALHTLDQEKKELPPAEP